MGLNWSEGLGRLSQGLGQMGELAYRREMAEAEAARQENLERLRQQNQLDRDERGHKQALELQDRADGRADARLKASDVRAERAERGRDTRQGAREKASDERLDRRLALDGEKFARQQNETRLDNVREDERASTADLMKLQGEISKAQAEYDSAKLAADPNNPGALAQHESKLAELETLMEESRRRQLQSRQDIGAWNQRIRPDVGTAMREQARGGPAPMLPQAGPGLVPVPREARSRFSDALSRDDDALIPAR